jgi:hypothetical protein
LTSTLNLIIVVTYTTNWSITVIKSLIYGYGVMAGHVLPQISHTKKKKLTGNTCQTHVYSSSSLDLSKFITNIVFYTEINEKLTQYCQQAPP